jgi:hypothetical protein
VRARAREEGSHSPAGGPGSNEDLALVLERGGRVDEAQEALKRALTIWDHKRCLPYVKRVREHVESLRQAQV